MSVVGNDEDALSLQAVECFERYSSDSQWVPFGTGTVLWQAADEGRLQQRLLVMQRENGDWACELEALDFPDPAAMISCIPEDAVVTWRRQGQPREFAMAFTSRDGCMQVWEDVQALQVAMGVEGLEGGDETLMHTLCGGSGDGEIASLPEPNEDALPELVMRLTESQHAVMMLLIQQIVQQPGSDAAGAANEVALAIGGSRDYIGSLCKLAAPLREVAAASAASSSRVLSETAASDEESAAEARATRRLQLATVFKALLGHVGDEPALLQRLIQPDALLALFSAIEGDDSRRHLQTAHVNTQHVNFVTEPRRFHMPVPITDGATLDRIHQNFAITYLLECALPLAIEPMASAALSEVQTANARDILANLMKDATFMRALFDGLREEAAYTAIAEPSPPARDRRAIGPADAQTPGSVTDVAPSELGNGSPSASADAMHVCTPSSVGSMHSDILDTVGCGSCDGGRASGSGAGTSAPPEDQPRLLQLWGLLRELSTLTATLYPLLKVRFYKVVFNAGLLGGLAAALASPACSGPLLQVQVCALDVLLMLLAHDPSILRIAATTSPGTADTSAWDASRADARTLLGGMVLMLGEGTDEGPLVQACEVFRIIVDTSTMEPHEQNAFLDHLYCSGHIASLLAALRSSALAFAPGNAVTAANADGTPTTSTTNPTGTGTSSTGASATNFGSFVHKPITSDLGRGVEAKPSVGASVVRLECLLDVLIGTLGQHGYRSRRTLLDPVLWEALRCLLSQPRHSLRHSALRFIRLALGIEPSCAALLSEQGVLPLFFRQLSARASASGLPRDTLTNSGVLSTLQAIVDDERLGQLRHALATNHRAELNNLAANGVATATLLLEAADAAAQPVLVPSGARDGDGRGVGIVGGAADGSNRSPANRAGAAGGSGNNPVDLLSAPLASSPQCSSLGGSSRGPSSPGRASPEHASPETASPETASSDRPAQIGPPGRASPCGVGRELPGRSSPDRSAPRDLSPERSNGPLSMVERSLLQAQQLQVAANGQRAVEIANVGLVNGSAAVCFAEEVPWLSPAAASADLLSDAAGLSPAAVSPAGRGSPTRPVAKAPSPPYTLTSPLHTSTTAHATQHKGVENWENNKQDSPLGAAKLHLGAGTADSDVYFDADDDADAYIDGVA